MSIQEDIAIRVKEQSPGSLLFINDFHEYDNEYVSKLLSLMASYGTLVRLAKGIYYKPIQTEFGVVYPSTERIIKAIAEHEKAEILPTGEYALNALGMSTTSGISGDWWHILQAAWNNEYRWNSQIAFPT